MKSDYYFDECKDCLHSEYSDKLYCCQTSRLGLAFHRMWEGLWEEIPAMKKVMDDYKYCNWYQKGE